MQRRGHAPAAAAATSAAVPVAVPSTPAHRQRDNRHSFANHGTGVLPGPSGIGSVSQRRVANASLTPVELAAADDAVPSPFRLNGRCCSGAVAWVERGAHAGGAAHDCTVVNGIGTGTRPRRHSRRAIASLATAVLVGASLCVTGVLVIHRDGGLDRRSTAEGAPSWSQAHRRDQHVVDASVVRLGAAAGSPTSRLEGPSHPSEGQRDMRARRATPPAPLKGYLAARRGTSSPLLGRTLAAAAALAAPAAAESAAAAATDHHTQGHTQAGDDGPRTGAGPFSDTGTGMPKPTTSAARQVATRQTALAILDYVAHSARYRIPPPPQAAHAPSTAGSSAAKQHTGHSTSRWRSQSPLLRRKRHSTGNRDTDADGGPTLPAAGAAGLGFTALDPVVLVHPAGGMGIGAAGHGVSPSVDCAPYDPYGLWDVFGEPSDDDRLNDGRAAGPSGGSGEGTGSRRAAREPLQKGSDRAVARAYLVQCVDAGAAEAAGRHSAVLWPVWRVSAAVDEVAAEEPDGGASTGGVHGGDVDSALRNGGAALAHAAFDAPCRLAGGASAADCTVRSVIVKRARASTTAARVARFDVRRRLPDTAHWGSSLESWHPMTTVHMALHEVYLALMTAHTGHTPRLVAAGFMEAGGPAPLRADGGRYRNGAAARQGSPGGIGRCRWPRRRGDGDAIVAFSVALLDGCTSPIPLVSWAFARSQLPRYSLSQLRRTFHVRLQAGAVAMASFPEEAEERAEWWRATMYDSECAATAWPPVQVPRMLLAPSLDRRTSAAVLVLSLAHELAVHYAGLCGAGVAALDQHAGNFVLGGRSGCHVTQVDVDHMTLAAWGSGDAAAAYTWARVASTSRSRGQGDGGGGGGGVAAAEVLPPDVPADPSPALVVDAAPYVHIHVPVGTLGCSDPASDDVNATCGAAVAAARVRPCVSSADCELRPGFSAPGVEWWLWLQGDHGVCVPPDPGTSKEAALAAMPPHADAGGAGPGAGVASTGAGTATTSTVTSASGSASDAVRMCVFGGCASLSHVLGTHLLDLALTLSYGWPEGAPEAPHVQALHDISRQLSGGDSSGGRGESDGDAAMPETRLSPARAAALLCAQLRSLGARCDECAD